MTRRRLAAAMFAVAAVGVGLAPHGVEAATAPYDVLPAGWRADIGAPVELADGTVIVLYGDTFSPAISRNTVVVDGVPIRNAIQPTASGSYYWPGDAVELPDGRLFVVMGEQVDMLEASQAVRDMGMAFEPLGADAFIVDDPRSAWSWRTATKIEDGPWGDASVQFSDQWPIVFKRASGSFETEAYTYDPADPTLPWTPIDANLPDSFGTFTAVQTATGWWGISAAGWDEFAVWRADDLTGTWEQVDSFTTATRTYDHQLNLLDGHVVHRWSNGEGSGRVEYAPFAMEGS